MTASAADLDDYAAEMLRVSCRVVDAYRTEDPQIVARVMDEVLHVPAPPGAPNPLWALVGALAVQVDPDVPWRQRFAWTHDIAAVAAPIPEPVPSSASYRDTSAALCGAEWGVPPTSPTTLRRTA